MISLSTQKWLYDSHWHKNRYSNSMRIHTRLIANVNRYVLLCVTHIVILTYIHKYDINMYMKKYKYLCIIVFSYQRWQYKWLKKKSYFLLSLFFHVFWNYFTELYPKYIFVFFYTVLLVLKYNWLYLHMQYYNTS